MADIGSSSWIAALNDRLSTVGADPDRPSLTIMFHIGDHQRWTITIDPDAVSATEDVDGEADLTVTASGSVADRIINRQLSAQRAFLDGELRIGGDVDQFIAQRSLFQTLARAI